MKKKLIALTLTSASIFAGSATALESEIQYSNAVGEFGTEACSTNEYRTGSCFAIVDGVIVAYNSRTEMNIIDFFQTGGSDYSSTPVEPTFELSPEQRKGIKVAATERATEVGMTIADHLETASSQEKINFINTNSDWTLSIEPASAEDGQVYVKFIDPHGNEYLAEADRVEAYVEMIGNDKKAEQERNREELGLEPIAPSEPPLPIVPVEPEPIEPIRVGVPVSLDNIKEGMQNHFADDYAKAKDELNLKITLDPRDRKNYQMLAAFFGADFVQQLHDIMEGKTDLEGDDRSDALKTLITDEFEGKTGIEKVKAFMMLNNIQISHAKNEDGSFKYDSVLDQLINGGNVDVDPTFKDKFNKFNQLSGSQKRAEIEKRVSNKTGSTKSDRHNKIKNLTKEQRKVITDHVKAKRG